PRRGRESKDLLPPPAQPRARTEPHARPRQNSSGRSESFLRPPLILSGQGGSFFERRKLLDRPGAGKDASGLAECRILRQKCAEPNEAAIFPRQLPNRSEPYKPGFSEEWNRVKAVCRSQCRERRRRYLISHGFHSFQRAEWTVPGFRRIEKR